MIPNPAEGATEDILRRAKKTKPKVSFTKTISKVKEAIQSGAVDTVKSIVSKLDTEKLCNLMTSLSANTELLAKFMEMEDLIYG